MNGDKGRKPWNPWENETQAFICRFDNNQFFKNPLARPTHNYLLIAVPACKSRDVFANIVAAAINTAKHLVCRATLMRKWNQDTTCGGFRTRNLLQTVSDRSLVPRNNLVSGLHKMLWLAPLLVFTDSKPPARLHIRHPHWMPREEQLQ